jgi:hypothetical protein
MVYSIDMRERAVTFVRDGGSQVEACRLFGVSRKTLYLWLQRKHQVTLPRHRRAHKIDPVRLAADVAVGEGAIGTGKIYGEMLRTGQAGLTVDQIGLMMGGAHGMEVVHHAEA